MWLGPVRLGPYVALPTTDGRKMLLVRRTEPERVVLLILDPLGLQLPLQPLPASAHLRCLTTRRA